MLAYYVSGCFVYSCICCVYIHMYLHIILVYVLCIYIMLCVYTHTCNDIVHIGIMCVCVYLRRESKRKLMK